MSNKLYVGNLDYETREQDLSEIFSQHGEVVSCKIITDRDTGRSKGFGFIEFASEDQANAAKESLNGHQLGRRNIRVDSAQQRQGGGGGGGHRGGRGGGRY